MTNDEHNLTPDDLAAVQQIEADCGGTLSFAIRNLSSGEILKYRCNVKCKTASVIKLPILVHTALLVEEDELSWEEPLVLTEIEKVGGSGVLTRLTEGLTLSIRDTCMLMTIISDNTATNMMIERLGVKPVNQRMRQLGFPVTSLFRKAYKPDGTEGAAFGLGVTTAGEMCDLVCYISNQADAGDRACRTVVDMMSEQIYRDCIPRMLPADWSYAGKTGSLDAVRNDVALVTASDGRRWALAVMCQDLPVVDWTPDNAGMVAIAKVARIFFR